MKKSNELLDVAKFVFVELQQVGKDPFDVSIFQLDHTGHTLYGWSAVPIESGLSVFSYTLPPTEHSFISTIFDQHLQKI